MPQKWLTPLQAELRAAEVLPGADAATIRDMILEGILRGEIRTKEKLFKSEAPVDHPLYGQGDVLDLAPGLVIPHWSHTTVDLTHRKDLERYLAPQQATKAAATDKGGAPLKIPHAVVIEVGAWLSANGIPNTQAEVERKIQEVLGRDNEVCPSTARTYAKNLITAHRRAIESNE